MLPGPVFYAELLMTARRKRNYALRFLYGFILLVLVWEYGFNWLVGPRGKSLGHGQMTIREMAELGRQIFTTFAVTQGIVLFFLTPALVAGAIAEERQRKTLHYLLVSPLSSGEIILGKLAARLLHIGVILTLGVPIQCMLRLFGGIPMEVILLVYAGTCSTVLFLAALSVLVSSYSKRPRDAISLVYVVAFAWAFGPVFASELPRLGTLPLKIYEVIQPFNVHFGSSNPLYLWTSGQYSRQRHSEWLGTTAWMIAIQMVLGLFFILWAVAGLRAVSRKSSEAGDRSGRVSRGKRKMRLLPRPECGDEAMLWKERYVSRTSRSTKIVWLLLLTGVLSVLAYSTYLIAGPAFRELRTFGYGGFEVSSRYGNRGNSYQNRSYFNGFLRAIGSFVYVAWVMGIMSASATSVTSEREEETWISLTSTPLDGWEIIRAKMFGAVWGTRGLGFLLLVLWALGMAAGSVHPFGFVSVVIQTAVFIWFATALGVFISLRSKTSTRAMMAAIGILLALNGGYLMCCFPLQPDTSLVLSGITPFVEFVSLIDYQEFWCLVHGQADSYGNLNPEAVMTCLMSTFLYATGALTLTVLAVAGFDDELDRPSADFRSPSLEAVTEESAPEDSVSDAGSS